jgi:hypothetical protein
MAPAYRIQQFPDGVVLLLHVLHPSLSLVMALLPNFAG